MKDLPFFTTENGVASLILREIPYKKAAYVKLLSSCTPAALLEECVSFCRACGAERIFACGDVCLQRCPLYTCIWEMARPLEGLCGSDACLFPVTQETVKLWQDTYNQKMAAVDNAAYMDAMACKEMLERGDGYFVHKDGVFLGIGRASGDTVDAVIAVRPGAGETVLRTLAALLQGDAVKLQVASTNERAIRLYERLGFVAVKEISRWYQVL